MAIFKVARKRVDDVRSNTWNGYDCESVKEVICKYRTAEDLDNLMSYCMRKASDILPVNVDLYSPEAVASQFLYIQRCSGKQLDTKAYHYILSFDTQKYENFVSVDDIKAIMAFFAHDFLQKHQAVLCLHTNKKTHYHVHIIVDPVSFYNYHKFRNNMQGMKNRLAFDILSYFHIALEGVSYYDERWKLRESIDETGIDLYQPMIGTRYYL